MKLEDFYKDYLQNRGPNDCLCVYFYSCNGEGFFARYIEVDAIRQSIKDGGLLAKVEVLRHGTYSVPTLDGLWYGVGGIMRIWKAELDPMQASLALRP